MPIDKLGYLCYNIIQGNIIALVENGVLTTRYEYDINGYRVRKYTPNGTHKYYRNGEQILAKEITVGNKEFLTELFRG